MKPVVFVALVGLAACDPYSKSQFMIDGAPKAAFDLHCPKEQLEVVEIPGGSMGVRGCGRQARYQLVPNVGWVLDSTAEPQRAGPPSK